MPKIIVQIEWDEPDDPHWLNADNVKLALQAYCRNTRFVVEEVTDDLAARLERRLSLWKVGRRR